MVHIGYPIISLLASGLFLSHNVHLSSYEEVLSKVEDLVEVEARKSQLLVCRNKKEITP